MMPGYRIYLAVLLAVLLWAPTAIAQSILVTGCPIYRDTDNGKKSGCWLIEDPATGVRYDISGAPTKPDWNFQVLVEGEVSSTQDNACGGLVAGPVRVSVLETRCTRHLLPAEGFSGRKFQLPARNVRPLSVERKAPDGPIKTRTFSLFFDFDRDFVVYQLDDYLLDEAISWIRATNPSQIAVTGFAATVPHPASSGYAGPELQEPAALAQKRAEKIAFALDRLGVDPAKMTVSWKTDNSASPDAEGADGLVETSRRRVEIKTTP